MVDEQVEKAMSENAVICYLDEVMFTTKSVLNRAFSNQYANIMIDMKQNKTKTTAVIAAITHEHGMLLWKQYENSVNIDKFKGFCYALR